MRQVIHKMHIREYNRNVHIDHASLKDWTIEVTADISTPAGDVLDMLRSRLNKTMNITDEDYRLIGFDIVELDKGKENG